VTKDEFLQRFQLNALAKSKHHSAQQKKTSEPIESAVLVALTEQANQLSLVLTKRSQHLKHHPGQISFPGGKVEKFDKNIIETALRETQEEIGIDAEYLNPVGRLHCYHTLTGFRITPIVALIKPNSNIIIDSNEVDEIFYLPISHFINKQNHLAIEIEQNRKRHKVHFIPYKHYNIWGATAAIISDLSIHIR
jgi:8-oxo-dGTP pyrophosphatase MutT (NUDIX family)